MNPTQCQNESAKALILHLNQLICIIDLHGAIFRCVGSAITYAGSKEDQSLELPCFLFPISLYYIWYHLSML